MNKMYHLNNSRETGVFGVWMHAKNTLTANYRNDTIKL